VIADGNGFRITAADYVARMKEQPPAFRGSYASIERKREFLDLMVRHKVLAAEAFRQGLDRDPEVLAALEKLMVQRLVQRTFAGSATGDTRPSETELRAYYEAHRADYQRPARRRIALRHFEAPASGPERARAEKEAKGLLARLRAPGGAGAAAAEPREGEEDGAGASGSAAGSLVDAGFLSREELAARHGDKVAAAAFALRSDGDPAPVVATERGFYVLRVDARQEALERSFEQVREQLVAKLAREAKTKEFEATMARLRAEARVRIDDAVLEQLVVE
jgi:peptidyl-prolyl cis-trans isomerase C